MIQSKTARALPNALAIDVEALQVLDAALIEEQWFENYEIPPDSLGIRRVQVGDIVYIVSRSAENCLKLLVINISSSGVFRPGDNKRSIFERILRVSMRHFDRNVSIPTAWQVYHEGSKLSVYAANLYRSTLQRIYFEQSPDGDDNIYAYAQTERPEDLDKIVANTQIYRRVMDKYLEAATSEEEPLAEVGKFGILLGEPLGRKLSTPGTLTDWYERLLSTAQRDFVKRDHANPVRLRGAAGTGKTQAMVVKALWDLYNRTSSDQTIAFLTHSSSLAHDVVRGMLGTLDPTEKWAKMKTPDGQGRLWIGTLYELAQERLGYVDKGLRPLSIDGREGREWQRVLISDAINVTVADPVLVIGARKNCPAFLARLKDVDARAAVVEDIMNEFACVLDAENIRKGTPEGERYVNAARESWQMQLDSAAEAAILLNVHESYGLALRAENYLSMDQMIADYSRYLTTHEWSQLRNKLGFDLIFVDEYHYFTRLEAMTLHNLFKMRAAQKQRWPLMMAYDLKQSVSDAGLSGGLERFRNPGVGETVPVDLKEVFRSTPQIARFLQSLDGSFPAIDLEGEFQAYQALSNQADGETPECFEYATDLELINRVFAEATDDARGLEGGGRQVAVLCINENLFDRYRNSPRVQDNCVSMTSREDLRQLSYARRKVVFSMPEYVAGLQFSVVYLIHVDDVDLSDENISAGGRRRYVSRVYLGASRASKKLILASSKSRGGISSLLSGPISDGTLRYV